MYRLALCRLQNIDDAEDVYQDVFLRFFQQEAADWGSERTKAWLLRATVNRCADIHRFRLRRPVLALEDIPEVTRHEDEGAELWDAVARLPVKLRTAVHLHYAEGYSTEEIAALLGVPSATVRPLAPMAGAGQPDGMEGQSLRHHQRKAAQRYRHSH